MPAVTQIIEKREGRRTRSRRSPANKLALNCSGLLSLVIALFCMFLALEYTALTRNLPSIETLPLLVDPPGGLYLQPTRFYDRSGEHLILELQNPAAKGAQYLSFPNQAAFANSDGKTYLPGDVISATIAASDPGFWSHPGFSLTGILQNAHNTVAQRLVSTLLLQDEPEGLRKALRERLLAGQVTERYGRPKVIEWYLNTVDFGNLTYGIDAASRLYFGKSAGELDLAQAATLAAIADNPSLDSNDSPELLMDRQRRILWDMLRLRMIRPMEGVEASREEPVFIKNAFQGKTIRVSDLEPKVAPAFVHLAFEQLTARIPRSRLERGGLRILTTLDYDLQQQLACASSSQVQRLEPDLAGTPAGPAADCPAARLLPSMSGKIESAPENLAADGIILDPQTGEILALTGQLPDQTGNGYLATHPSGSLSTLFIYMTAFTRGLGPASLLWDIPPADNTSQVQNFDQQYHGPLRLRMALVNDYLVPAEQVLTQVGIENVWRTARQLGLTYPESTPAANQPTPPSTLSLFRSLDLVEVSHALSVFANQGILSGRASEIQTSQADDGTQVNPALPPMHPKTILRVDDLSGKVYLDWSATQSRPILTPELAYLMTNVLSDETARWPSLGHPNPLEVGRPAAAKLSSTFDGASNWVIGYTPQRFVGVWLGQPTQTGPLPAETAHSLRYAAAGLWHAMMQYSSRYLPFQTFNVPSGLSFMQVCDPSGLLPTVACPNVVDEVFLAGNEPVQIDTLYRLVSINRESGRLATIFSPPDMVEPRAYISVPPEATLWAERAGLETPPDMYDILPLQLPAWKTTQISTPAMFARVRGQVTISGTASGENLAFYRVQVGQGPDPTLWYQVGVDSQQPITEGKLATWDTTQLDGLYAVQLLLVRRDQSAERSTILVTVDNQPPQIKITNPIAGEAVQKSARPSIVFLAEVEENLGIDNVAFMVDGRLIARLIQAPFAISWTTTTGNHTLRIIATDEAGNTSEAQSTFDVK